MTYFRSVLRHRAERAVDVLMQASHRRAMPSPPPPGSILARGGRRSTELHRTPACSIETAVGAARGRQATRVHRPDPAECRSRVEGQEHPRLERVSKRIVSNQERTTRFPGTKGRGCARRTPTLEQVQCQLHRRVLVVPSRSSTPSRYALRRTWPRAPDSDSRSIVAGISRSRR